MDENKLKKIEKESFHQIITSLRSLSSTDRLNAILSLRDPASFIRRIRPDEFYYLVNSIGVEDSLEILEMATPEQRRVFVDLEMWSDQSFKIERFDEVFDMIADHSIDLAIKMIRELDPELVVLDIFKDCQVVPARDADDLDAEATFLTPDNQYMVLCSNPLRIAHLKRFLDCIYANGVEFSINLISGGMFDTPSSLEHTAFQFSRKRLQDFGFPDESERFALFEPFDYKTLQHRIDSRQTMPFSSASDVVLNLVLTTDIEQLQLWKLLSSINPKKAIAWSHLFLYLTNKVLYAIANDLSDEEAWKTASRNALAMISLGLQYLSQGNDDKARYILENTYPIELYRTGFELVRPYNIRAKKICSKLGGAKFLTLFGSPISDVLESLIAFPPVYHESAEKEGSVLVRDFYSLQDIFHVSQVIDKAEAVLEFAEKYLGYQPGKDRYIRDSIVAPTFSNVITTAWARLIMSGVATIEPLCGEEIKKLRSLVFEGNRISDKFIGFYLENLFEDKNRYLAIKSYVESSIRALEEAISGLNPDQEIDVRFIGDAILVRLGK